MSSAGPAAKAEDKNRGANMAVIQKPLPGKPQKRKAVTVWILMAHGIDM
jgi:hypothetical protein